MKVFLFVPIILSGVKLGFCGSSKLWPVPSRATQIANLFEEICLKRAKGLPAAPSDLGLFKPRWPEHSWIDPKSRSFLNLTNSGCDIETVHPNALSQEDAEQLLHIVSALQAKHFPDLIFDPKAQMGTVFAGWAQGSAGSKERWGLFLFAYPDWKENAGSTLMIHFPATKGL